MLLAGLAALPSAAQTQVQARTLANAPNANTANPELAVDESMTTSATLKPSILLGAATLRVHFPTAIQPGQQAMLYVKAGAELLDATVLGRMTIQTYSSKNATQLVQEVPLTDNSVNVNLLSGSTAINKVAFTTAQSFDELELRVGALLNVTAVDVYAAFGTVSPLPVQLTAFQGKATETGVALTWETAAERNTDYFEVQRAEGLTTGYSSLGQVKSAGTSIQAHTYQFVDTHATGLHYYRLRQVDADGTESFSPVVTVSAGLLASLTAYPTLATSVVNVAGPADMHLSIFDQQGQQVQVADISANQRQQLDVSNLPSGMYFLRDAATGQSARFIKSSGR